MAWNFDDNRPIYSQLVEILETKIVSGEYQPGAKLPSVRELAITAAVNPNTMQRAFSELEREGLVNTNRTSGRTVTEDPNMLRQVRSQLARGHVDYFFKKMKELGYTNQEITSLANEAASKEDNQ
ncbi:MAG: GntR family transcriptional regulator [Lachnospiraceae bacterium]|nr:GntR family transcriptional regulator [Lachnospiraceae bacterium]